MEYGDKTFKDDMLFLYQGFDPAKSSIRNRPLPMPSLKSAIKQRDADVLFMWKKVTKIPLSISCLVHLLCYSTKFHVFSFD